LTDFGNTLRPVIRRSLILAVFAALACAAAPGATSVPAIEPGVTLGGVPVGGLTTEPARARVAATVSKPLVVTYRNMSWYAWPDSLRLDVDVDAAVHRALSAGPGDAMPLAARWSHAEVRRLAAAVARGVARAPVDAQLVRIDGTRPVIAEATAGVAVRTKLLQRRIAEALRDGVRTPVAVPTRSVRAARTKAHFGALILISRSANALRLYNGKKLVHKFGVATGQAVYPTPSGLWHIVNMQRNPWWTPPDSPWARGAHPVPPGPGNPLGTRWMGLDAAGVGIHGTPNPASIGYSASHGCIRMRIPDAEWLFEHVEVGTPVYIV
jgi:lipoprotein-anchoring transpeptidase ErfK/SrfK